MSDQTRRNFLGAVAAGLTGGTAAHAVSGRTPPAPCGSQTSRPGEDPPEEPWGNLPEEDELIRALRRAVTACDAVHVAHGPDCACQFCTELQGTRYMIASCRDTVQSYLVVLPEDYEKLMRRLRSGGPLTV